MHTPALLSDPAYHDEEAARAYIESVRWPEYVFCPLCGVGKFVEADETFVGGRARNRAYRALAPKKAVVALVERQGRVRSHHVPEVIAATLRPILERQIDKASHFRTDESGVYWEAGEKFAS